ncbi:PAS domain S-box protein [Candidatus Riflebacteria bacterium]
MDLKSKKKSSYKIVVIEDDTDLREMILRILIDKGYKTEGFSGGNEAFTWLEKEAGEQKILLLLDYILPDMNGEEFIGKLVRKSLSFPFIIITGFGDHRVVVEMLKKGAKDYLLKDEEFILTFPAVVERTVNKLEMEEELTDREQELKESEKKYRHFFQFAAEPIFIIDPVSGSFLDVNEKAARLLGYSREELLFLGTDDIDAPQAMEKSEQISKELKVKGSLTFEHVFIRKDGNEILVEVSNRLTELSGEKVIISLVRDISQRKDSVEVLLKNNTELEEKLNETTAELNNTSKNLEKETEERKRVEKEMNKYFEQFKTILDFHHDHLLLEIDIEGNIHDFRSADSDAFFDAREDLAGKCVSDLFPMEVSNLIKEKVKESLEKRKPCKTSFALKSDSLHQSLFEVTLGKKWGNIEGSPRIVCLVREISEDQGGGHGGQVQVGKSDSGWNDLTRVVPGNIAKLDPEGNILFIKGSAPDCSTGGVIGSNYYNYYPIEAREQMKKIHDVVLKTGKIRNFEMTATSSKGKQFWTANSIGPLQQNGANVGIIFFSRDITTQKQTELAIRTWEEKYRLLFDQSPDAILLLDPDTGGLIEYNKQAIKTLGHSPDEFKKLTIYDFEVDRSKSEIKEHLKKTLAKGGDIYETRTRTKGGEISEMLVNFKVLSLSKKKLIMGIWRDITGQKHTQQKLTKATDEIAEKLKKKTEEIALLREELQRFRDNC